MAFWLLQVLSVILLAPLSARPLPTVAALLSLLDPQSIFSSAAIMPAHPAIQAIGLLPPVDNIRAAYSLLEHRVFQAVQTQVGDAARLGEVRQEVLSLLQAAEPVCLVTLQLQILAY